MPRRREYDRRLKRAKAREKKIGRLVRAGVPLSRIARRQRVSRQRISQIWQRYCRKNGIKSRPVKEGRRRTPVCRVVKGNQRLKQTRAKGRRSKRGRAGGSSKQGGWR